MKKKKITRETPVTELGLHGRIVKALHNFGIFTVGDFLDVKSLWWKIPGLGASALFFILAAIVDGVFPTEKPQTPSEPETPSEPAEPETPSESTPLSLEEPPYIYTEV